MKHFLLVCILIIFLFQTALAQTLEKTGFVTDTLFLTLREGPGRNYSVKKIIKSDDKVSILEEKNEYLNVETTDGDSGWVEKQYIIYSTPKSVVIEELNQTISKLEARIETLSATQDPLQKKITEQQDTFKQTIASLEVELEKERAEKQAFLEKMNHLQKTLDTLVQKSAHVLETQAENETLKKQSTSLSLRLNEIETQGNDQLKTGMIKWFLAGVGVLLLGWLLGRSVSSKKRRSGLLLD